LACGKKAVGVKTAGCQVEKISHTEAFISRGRYRYRDRYRTTIIDSDPDFDPDSFAGRP